MIPTTTFYSSDLRRAAGLVTFTPRTFALQDVHQHLRGEPAACNVPLKNECPVAAADVVRDLGRKAFVVHEEKVNFPDVVHQELLKAIGKEMAGLKSC